jgi:hypothetical protein
MYVCSNQTRFPASMRTATELQLNLSAIQLRFQPLIMTECTHREQLLVPDSRQRGHIKDHGKSNRREVTDLRMRPPHTTV